MPSGPTHPHMHTRMLLFVDIQPVLLASNLDSLEGLHMVCSL
jgi:hypothetical protein